VTTIDARGVSVSFGGPPVVRDLDLVVPGGAWVGLIGPNGAGKSTLMRAIAGLVPYSGDVCYDGEAVPSMSRRSLARLVAFVPQNPFTPEGMLVADYVLMGRTPHIAYLGSESRSDLGVVADVLERLDLVELASRPLGSLSGGELQRAVLGRALAQQAPVLLLDEPTSALDVGHQQQVLELVDHLRVSGGLTVVSAMHDLTLAGQFADKLVMLDRGRAVATGTAAEVLTEATISRHYGATVRVIRGPDGEVLVVPVRETRSGIVTATVVDL
jgi:iron complex transport system ATP-binding protein